METPLSNYYSIFRFLFVYLLKRRRKNKTSGKQRKKKKFALFFFVSFTWESSLKLSSNRPLDVATPEASVSQSSQQSRIAERVPRWAFSPLQRCFWRCNDRWLLGGVWISWVLARGVGAGNWWARLGGENVAWRVVEVVRFVGRVEGNIFFLIDCMLLGHFGWCFGRLHDQIMCMEITSPLN